MSDVAMPDFHKSDVRGKKRQTPDWKDFNSTIYNRMRHITYHYLRHQR